MSIWNSRFIDVPNISYVHKHKIILQVLCLMTTDLYILCETLLMIVLVYHPCNETLFILITQISIILTLLFPFFKSDSYPSCGHGLGLNSKLFRVKNFCKNLLTRSALSIQTFRTKCIHIPYRSKRDKSSYRWSVENPPRVYSLSSSTIPKSLHSVLTTNLFWLKKVKHSNIKDLYR